MRRSAFAWLSALRRSDLLAGAWAGMVGLAWFLAPSSVAMNLVMGLSGLVLAGWRPVASLVLMALVMPFEQARELGSGITLYTGELLLVTALPGWIWNLGRHPGWLRMGRSWVVWVMPFLLALGVSLTLGFSAAAIKGTLRWLEFFVAWAAGMVFLRSRQQAGAVWMALLLAALLSAGWGLAQTAGLASLGPDPLRITWGAQEVARAAAGFGPNTLAGFLAMLWPFSLALALFHDRDWGRAAGLFASGLLLAGILATFCLSVIAALMAVGGVLGWLRAGRWRWSWLVLSALVLMAWSWSHPELFSNAFWETKLGSWQGRGAYAVAALQLWSTSPVWGIGPGLYRWLAPDLAAASDNMIGFLTHPHSLYLSVLSELGAWGLASLLYFGWRALRGLGIGLKRLPAGWPAAAGWSMLAGLAVFALTDLTDHGLIHDRGMHAALALAAALAWTRRPDRVRRPEPAGRFELAWQKEGPEDVALALQAREQARRPLYQLLEQSLRGTPAPRVLEVGSGPALDALWLAQRPEREVHALDRSVHALQRAEQAARALGRTLSLHRADVRNTQLPPGQFDLIFSQGMLEHFPDPQKVWKEVDRLLRPGGSWVVDVPQRWNPYTLVKRYRQALGTWPWGWERSYSLGALKSAAAGQGLRYRASAGYGYWGGPSDLIAGLRKRSIAHWPRFWNWLEGRWGAYWMMNLVAKFQKPLAERVA